MRITMMKAVTLVALLMVLSSCGQIGPLYLPDNVQSQDTPTQSDVPK
jgi:predicted small lipoprotein YifL